MEKVQLKNTIRSMIEKDKNLLMIFTWKHVEGLSEINYNAQIIIQVNSIIYLGLKQDNQLAFIPYISS